MSTSLPETFYTSLKEQYGVSYDPATSQAAVLCSDATRHGVLSGITTENPNFAAKAKTISLPVQEGHTEFVISDQFYNDAICRHTTTLSIQGVGTDGSIVNFTWPHHAIPETDTPEAKKLRYEKTMGAALNALRTVAGPSCTEYLTRLTTQEILGDITVKINFGQIDSPFMLEDGRKTKITGGIGVEDLQCFIKQTGNSSFDVALHIHVAPELRSSGNLYLQAENLMENPMDSPFISINPASSWQHIHMLLHVSFDQQDEGPPTMNIKSELPHFRYHFTELE
ncbi:hypothetical protein ACTPOE_08375 [Castellaniella sp. WN]